MKRTVILVALSLLCSGALWARSPRQAMVLKVRGPHVFHSKETYAEQASTGQMWTVGDSLNLKQGASVSLLELSKGRQLEISGPGEVKVTARGLEVSGATVRELGKVARKLSLTGENHRQIGGMTLREPIEMSRFKIRYSMLKLDGHQLTLTAPQSFDRLSLAFQFLEDYRPWMVDAGGHVQSTLDTWDRPVEEVTLEASRQGDRLVWQVPLPKRAVNKAWGLLIREEPAPDSPILLYTRVEPLSPAEQAELRELEAETRSWAGKEPSNAAPWLIYASVLEEKSQLKAALAATDRALALRPEDPGLRQLKARLLADMGAYKEAAQTLKP